MKKVRLALGVAGIAPALGVAVPAAAATHAPEGPAANASPAQVKTVRVDPAVGCTGKAAAQAHSFNFSIWVTTRRRAGAWGEYQVLSRVPSPD